MTNKWFKNFGRVPSFILIVPSFILVLLAVLLLLPLRIELDAASEVDALAFFRATDDSEKYRRASAAYDSERVRDQTSRQFYIERRVAHRVSNRDIETVTVKKAIGYASQSD